MRIQALSYGAIAGLIAMLVVVPATGSSAAGPVLTESPTTYQVNLPSPHKPGQRASQAITYTNHSGRTVTAKLSIQPTGPGAQTGQGAWGLSRSTLKIAAHRHASVTLTAFGTGVASGDHNNYLVASYGQTKLSISIGSYVEPPMYNLTVKATDRSGGPANPDLTIHRNATDGSGGCAGSVSGKSTQTMRVAPGNYNVFAPITSPDGTTTLADTDVSVTRDTTVTFDARLAHQVRFSFDGSAAAPVRILMGFTEPTWAPGPLWQDDCSILQQGLDPAGFYLLAGPAKAHFVMRTLWQKPGSADTNPSPYYYDLVNTSAGLPADPGYSIHTADLAQVKTTYRGEGTGTYPVKISTGAGIGSLGVQQMAPATVMWYRTPGVQWLRGVENNTLWESGLPTVYPAGPSSEVWNAAVIGPEVDAGGSVAGVDNRGDLWYIGNEFLVSSTPGRHSRLPRGLPGLSSTLTRDGVPVPLTENGVVTNAHVSPGAARYALTVTADHALVGSKISTYVQAAWNFSASTPSFGWEALPLMFVRMTPQGLDESNRAAAGTQTTIPISVDRQPQATPATITNVALESSTDDGATWQPLTVGSAASGWTTTVTNPSIAGFVSLRATVIDSAGNSVTETIIHAYEVNG